MLAVRLLSSVLGLSQITESQVVAMREDNDFNVAVDFFSGVFGCIDLGTVHPYSLFYFQKRTVKV